MIDVVATLLSQCSYILMKFAHIDSEKSGKSAFLSCKWISGISSLVVGSLLHVVVMPYCPLVLLATNGAIAIIMSALLAVWFLNERIVPAYDLPAFILISAGTITMVMVSQDQQTEVTTLTIESQLSSNRAKFFLVFYLLVLVSNFMMARWFTRQIKSFEE